MKNVNTKIAERYIVYAKKQKEYSNEECERMMYSLKIIFGELEKMMVLWLIAFIFGVSRYLLLSVFVVLSLRITMGGMHRKTFCGCLMFSICFFSSVIVMSQYVMVDWDIIKWVLYFVYVLYIHFRAPIPSSIRPMLNVRRKRKLKMYSFLVLTGWIYVVCFLQEKSIWKNCIEWTLLMQMVEILTVEGGRILWEKISLWRRSVNN